jgi:hypothetical protein
MSHLIHFLWQKTGDNSPTSAKKKEAVPSQTKKTREAKSSKFAKSKKFKDEVLRIPIQSLIAKKAANAREKRGHWPVQLKLMQNLCQNAGIRVPNLSSKAQKRTIHYFLLWAEHMGIIQRISGALEEIQVKKSEKDVFQSKLYSFFSPGTLDTTVQTALKRYGLEPNSEGRSTSRNKWPDAFNGNLSFKFTKNNPLK